MIKSMNDLIEFARRKGKKRIAVVYPMSKEVMEGLKLSEDLAYPVLFGNSDRINALASEVNLKDFEVYHAETPKEAAYTAISFVKERKADFLMKGKISTPDFLRAVLDKEKGLRSGQILSHVAVQEVAGYERLVFLTDAGMNIRPDLKTKVEILKNAIGILKNLGYEEIKAAGLASIEQVSENMPETIDYAVLSKMAERGVFGSNFIFDGPLGFDIVASREAAQMKGINTTVSQEADIWLCPDVASGNILSKALIYFAGAKVGGIIAGAKAPIILLSRSDTPDRKLYSIAFGIAALG